MTEWIKFKIIFLSSEYKNTSKNLTNRNYLKKNNCNNGKKSNNFIPATGSLWTKEGRCRRETIWTY